MYPRELALGVDLDLLLCLSFGNFLFESPGLGEPLLRVHLFAFEIQRVARALGLALQLILLM